MRWHGRRAARGNLGSDRVDHFDIKVSRFQRKLGAVAVQQHVGKDRNRIAAFDHAMDMAQRLQQFRTLYCDFHREIHEGSRNADNKGGAPQGFRQAQPGRRAGLFHAFLQALTLDCEQPGLGPGIRSGISPCAQSLRSVLALSPCDQSLRSVIPCDQSLRSVLALSPCAQSLRSVLAIGPCDQSWSWRLSDSISSANALSLPARFSIFRTAWSTVGLSRPPNRRPISGSDRSVKTFAKYIATCRGRTTLAVRRDDSKSARLTLYWRATMRWMSSIRTRFGSAGRIRSRISRSAISIVTDWPVSLL